MCELACEETSDWIMVDPWEAIQPGYQPTAVVLDHIAHEINDVIGGIAPYEGAPRSEYKPAQVSFLSGSDLLQTMSVRFSLRPFLHFFARLTRIHSNRAYGTSKIWTTFSANTACSSLSAAAPRSKTHWHH
jgi:hypothetical protein